MSTLHNVTDFDTQVLKASHELPILVDFWAPWCQPCVVLGPTLERLAANAQGRWNLAKVNVDQYPDISQRYRVQGIPAVKLFVEGQVVAEFTGALPESQIRAFLAQHLPPTATEQLLVQAVAAWEDDQPAQAKALLEQYQTSGPCTEASNVLDARLRLFTEPKQAHTLVADINASSKLALEADAIRHLSALLQHPPQASALPQSPATPHYLRFLAELTAQQIGPALEALIDALMLETNYREGAARTHGVALFGYLGQAHPLTKTYRRRFDMSLT